MKINFMPMCACKNNRLIRRHNNSASRSRDVTVNRSDVTTLRPNEQWMLVFSRFVCSGHTIACKKYYSVWVTVNNEFLLLVRRFGNGCYECRIASPGTKTVIHGNTYIFATDILIKEIGLQRAQNCFQWLSLQIVSILYETNQNKRMKQRSNQNKIKIDCCRNYTLIN